MMKYFTPFLITAVLWLPTTGFGQVVQTPVTPVTPIASSESDLLNAEDILEIRVGNHADLDQSVAVGQDGKINLRELGQFVAVGKTREVLRNEIQVEADKTLNNASIFLVLKERRLPRISVDGPVSAPGIYPLSPGMKVLDAISAAHGLSLKPNHYSLKLVRKDKIQILDVPKIYSNPESDYNPLLLPNDKLVFNEIELVRRKVTVLGQVAHPSTYETDNDTTVLTLLGQAGGISSAAALTKVTVTRGSTVIPLNLRPVLAEGKVDDSILKFRFEDGDVLSIPGVETKYQVLGQVVRPSTYIYPEQASITVLDALNAAGGPTPKANLRGATIQRVVNGNLSSVKVDYDSIQKKGMASANILVRPDDILIIPERKKPGPTLGDVFAPIGLLNLLGFRFFGN